MYELIDHIEMTMARNDLTVAERMDEVLKLGLHQLEMEQGIVSQIGGESYRVIRHLGEHDVLAIGQTLALNETYGALVLDHSGLLVIEEMQLSQYGSHPAYRTLRLGTYIGVPLIVRGQVFGALEFGAAKPRPKGYTDRQVNLAYVMGGQLAELIESDMAAQQQATTRQRRQRRRNPNRQSG